MYIMGNSIFDGVSGQWYRKWIEIICDAMTCYDKEKDNWIHLPGDGGYYDQDEYMMMIWQEIRVAYIKAKRDPDMINYLEQESERQTKQLTNKLKAIKGKR